MKEGIRTKSNKTFSNLVKENENKNEEVKKELEGCIANHPLVNIRSSDSLESAILDICKEGQKVKILNSLDSGFYEVEVTKDNAPTFVGYVSKDYCNLM